DTTTTTSCPSRRVRMTRSATRRSLSASATLEPPYFWTTMATVSTYHERCILPGRLRRQRHCVERIRGRDRLALTAACQQVLAPRSGDAAPLESGAGGARLFGEHAEPVVLDGECQPAALQMQKGARGHRPL